MLSKAQLEKVFMAASRGQVPEPVKEQRWFPACTRAMDVAGEDNKKMELSGHPAVFDQRADLGYFTEVVKPGAFADSIREDDVRALFNHESNLVLGRTKNGTLQLNEDDTGLAMRCDVADTSVGRDVMELVRRRDVTQGSIGFIVRKQTFFKENDTWVREIRQVQLFDVSPVTFPAYVGTDMNVRSVEAIISTFRNGPENLDAAEELTLIERQRESLRWMLALAEHV